jgi:PleD family two-component response regulator
VSIGAVSTIPHQHESVLAAIAAADAALYDAKWDGKNRVVVRPPHSDK